MTDSKVIQQTVALPSKSYKANCILLLASLLFSAVAFVLYTMDNSKGSDVLALVKLGYMFFFVVLYALLTWRWIKQPEYIVKPLLWLSLFQVVTVKVGEWNMGLNPFSVIGVSLDFDSISFTVNLIAIALLAFTWRYKRMLARMKY
ncbi:hypothetical protein L1286_05805 [Pseudoalteromonas sp. SMS1]|uniref:hypothetical protein n=1 Tax=Pseudoalteromonas sp. SMS1 TaxID=2908894 RepID=UPI001F2CEC51|nr:hypothetical protein [Pseudoalteromonas sp. SMS1]MCF2856974.1 hypothetical protein [Pseudoalteromonas sp. SMS1]